MLGTNSPPPPPVYDVDAQAWFDKVAGITTGFTDPFKTKGNNLIVALKAAGLFTQLQALWTFGVEVLGQEVVNAVSPNNYLMTKGGTTVLTAGDGIASNGTTGYYDTNYPLATATNISIGAVVAASAVGQPSISGNLNNSSMVCDMVPTSGGTAVAMRLAMTNLLTWANVVPTGHFAITRSLNAVAGYQDGVQKATISAANFTLPGDDLLWMRRAAVFTLSRLGIGYIATALSPTDVAALHAILVTFRS